MKLVFVLEPNLIDELFPIKQCVIRRFKDRIEIDTPDMLTPEEVQKVKDYMKTARHHGADEYDTDHIRNLTPTQIDTWIDNNVSDLVSAKSALKKMGRAILFLYKRLEIDG